MSKNNKLKNSNRSLILLGVIILILSYFWEYYYFFDLFSHFHLQYLIITIVLFFFSILLKDKIFILICLLLLSYLWLSISNTNIINNTKTTQINMYYLNSNWFIDSPESIIEDIKKNNPKYLAIVEINNKLHNKIVDELWYKNVSYINQSVSSIWFYTNENIILENKHMSEYPFLEIQTNDVHFLIIHPLPPLNQNMAISQKNNFQEINKIFKSIESEKKVIVWDFNSSSFSQVFKKYFWDYNYKTIYSWKVDSIFMLPIDYAISDKDILEIRSWGLKTSDHSPLLIQIK